MRVLAFVPLLLAGCAPTAWQSGLETAGMVVDTAAVVRARRLGLCGSPVSAVQTEADAAAAQAEVARLRTDLDEALRRLTEIRVDMARREAPLPQYDLPPVTPPPKPTAPPIPALPPPVSP